MAVNMDGDLLGLEPKTPPETTPVFTPLSRRVKELENLLVAISRGYCDALEAQKTSINALMHYLQNHVVVTEQLLQDLTVVRVRLDQSRAQQSACVERVMEARQAAAFVRSCSQAEAAAQRSREQKQRSQRPIQQTSEGELPPPAVRYTRALSRLRLLTGQKPRAVREEPDWGDDLIRFSSNDDISATKVNGEWIAGSPPRVGIAAQQHIDSSTSLSGANTTNIGSGRGTPGYTGVSPLDQEIDWQGYFGFSCKGPQIPGNRRNVDLESPTVEFAPSEHAGLRTWHCADQNAVGEEKKRYNVNQASQASDGAQVWVHVLAVWSPFGDIIELSKYLNFLPQEVSCGQPTTAGPCHLASVRLLTANTEARAVCESGSSASAVDGNCKETDGHALPGKTYACGDSWSGDGASSVTTSGKRKTEDHERSSSGTDARNGSGGAEVEGGAVRSGAVIGTGKSERWERPSGSRIARPAPGVLRTGLSLPRPKGDAAGHSNVRGAYGPAIQNAHHPYVPHDYEFHVQFNPPLKERAQHLRTVHIGNLPTGITLKALMSSVRGGNILKATLLDTIPLTGSPSALITFVDARGAADYVAFAGLHPIQFMGALAAVTMVDTPTSPMSYYVANSVKTLHCTRVLQLDGIPLARSTLLEVLDLDWAARLGLIENIRVRNEYSVVLTFASVEAALRASAIFGALRYRGSVGAFLPDPCAEPLSSLLRRQAEQDGHLENVSGQDDDVSEDDGELELSPGEMDGTVSGCRPRFLGIAIATPNPFSILDQDIVELF